MDQGKKKVGLSQHSPLSTSAPPEPRRPLRERTAGPRRPGPGPRPAQWPAVGWGNLESRENNSPAAPRQPLPRYAPWRSGRRLLYNRGRAGWLFHLGRGSPADPEPSAKPAPGPLPQLDETEAPGEGRAPGPRSHPFAPTHPSSRGSGDHARVGPRSAHSPSPPPLPSCCHRPRRRGKARAPRTRLRAGAGGLFIWRPHPLPPRGPAPPAPRGALGPDGCGRLARRRAAGRRGPERRARLGQAGPPPQLDKT